MAPWVWRFVTDEWTPHVDSAYADASAPYRAALTAPNGDVLEIASFPVETDARLGAWNRGERVAWIEFDVPGSTFYGRQLDLATGEWVPIDVGNLAGPYDGVPGSVLGLRRVAVLDDGRELWATVAEYERPGGYLIRRSNGAWEPLPGFAAVESAVKSGSVDGRGEPGFEAWYDPEWDTLVVLMQWGAWDAADSQLHTSKGRWFVTEIGSGGTADVVTTSADFVPRPPGCVSGGEALGNVEEPADAIIAGNALCGGETWWLYPPGATATR